MNLPENSCHRWTILCLSVQCAVFAFPTGAVLDEGTRVSQSPLHRHDCLERTPRDPGAMRSWSEVRASCLCPVCSGDTFLGLRDSPAGLSSCCHLLVREMVCLPVCPLPLVPHGREPSGSSWLSAVEHPFCSFLWCRAWSPATLMPGRALRRAHHPGMSYKCHPHVTPCVVVLGELGLGAWPTA